MASTIYIKQRDTARTVEDTLLDDGAAIDLTGATVVMVWKNRQDGTVSRKTTVALAADPTTGGVIYTPETDDVADAGVFYFEWEVTFGDATILTVPTRDQHTLVIEDDLDA